MGSARKGQGHLEVSYIAAWPFCQKIYLFIPKYNPILTCVNRYAYLLNLLAYLKGRRHFPSVSEWASGMYLSPLVTAAGEDNCDGGNHSTHVPSKYRVTNFQFQNRFLLWNSITSFALFAAPFGADLISRASSVTSALSHFSRGSSRRLSNLPRVSQWWDSLQLHFIGTPDNGDANGTVNASDTLVDLCVFCGTSPAQTPFITSCHHVACYFCVRAACAQDEARACPRCDVVFDSIRPWTSTQ